MVTIIMNSASGYKPGMNIGSSSLTPGAPGLSAAADQTGDNKLPRPQNGVTQKSAILALVILHVDAHPERIRRQVHGLVDLNDFARIDGLQCFLVEDFALGGDELCHQLARHEYAEGSLERDLAAADLRGERGTDGARPDRILDGIGHARWRPVDRERV